MSPIALPNGKTGRDDELYTDCLIQIDGHEFLTDLYKFGLIDFNMILGMDCLSKYQAQINCPKQKITLSGPKGEKIIHKGKALKCKVRLVTAIEASKLLG